MLSLQKKAEHKLQELFRTEFKSRQSDFSRLSLQRLSFRHFSKRRTGHE
jgi:hypothetical protein